jgi:hypothetical protein
MDASGSGLDLAGNAAGGRRPPDRRIRFRIGINIGDVIAHDTDVFGDGVNVAARLEAASPVGGICVSRAVRDHVRHSLYLPFEDIGKLTLKNIAWPVEGATEALMTDIATMTVPRAQPSRWSRRRVALLAPLLMCGALGAGWWVHRGPAALTTASPSATTASFTPPDVGLARAPRLSVVVLPFENLSGDRSEDYLADGITDDVATDLARLNELSAGQEAIVRRIGQTLNVALTDIESARSKRERPTNPDAFDLLLRARSLILHPMGSRERHERIALLEQALRLDSTSIRAMTELADAVIGTGTIDELGRTQDWLQRKVQELTKGDLSKPIVAVGWNSERFDGRNLALRLVALGYSKVFWYRGGGEAWEVAGLPETEVSEQEW